MYPTNSGVAVCWSSHQLVRNHSVYLSSALCSGMFHRQLKSAVYIHHGNQETANEEGICLFVFIDTVYQHISDWGSTLCLAL